MRIYDPTSENQVTKRILARRLSSLKGKTVGFISNGKEGTAGFFHHLEQLLLQLGVGQVIHRVKTNYSAPADDFIVDEIKQWDLAVTGLGDWGSCSSCSLHDSIIAEQNGVPGLAVITEQFASAADLVAGVLGATDYKFAIIPHPVSSASSEQLLHSAELSVEQLLQHVVQAD